MCNLLEFSRLLRHTHFIDSSKAQIKNYTGKSYVGNHISIEIHGIYTHNYLKRNMNFSAVWPKRQAYVIDGTFTD